MSKNVETKKSRRIFSIENNLETFNTVEKVSYPL